MQHRTLTLLPLVMLLALAPRAATADDSDHMHLTLTGPATPYATITHHIARQRGTVILTTQKTFAHGFGHHSKVALLTDADLTTLLDQLTALGAFTLPDRRLPTPRTRYTLTVQHQKRRHQLVAHDPEWATDPRYRALIAHIRTTIAAHTDPIPFRDALLLPHEAGTLHLRATPPATVTLDGIHLPGTTPITDLRLTTGRHRLTLTPTDRGEPRHYDITIEAGKTTALTVDLR